MRRFPPAALAAVLLLSGGSLAAQTPSQSDRLARPTRPAQAAQPGGEAQPAPPVVVYQDTPPAHEVQGQLREIMSRYPPSLLQVIQLDPTLLERADYLAAYPQLVAFLQQHPDVIRNPTFYFGRPYSEERQPQNDRERTLYTIRETISNIGILAGFLTAICLIYSLLRQGIEHRRWRRQIGLQTELQTKLLDRMTNNQELLAYLDTTAGRRFFELPAPVMAPSPMALSAPVARILWSIQLGVVVVAAGVGFWIARGTIDDMDLQSVFQVMGSLSIAVGIGFVVSALASWVLSQRMGLMSGFPAKVD